MDVLLVDSNSYFKCLDLPSLVNEKPELSSHREALSMAHELRKLEIENYWKRANYFWLFQAASLTLFGLIAVSKASFVREVLLVPAALGAVTAQVGWLTAKGSKFWQQNWESHVAFLEKAIEGNLTKIVLHHGETLPSVSKVNQRLLLLLLCSWWIVFLFVLFGEKAESFLMCHACLRYSVAIFGIVSATLFIRVGTNSGLATKLPAKPPSFCAKLGKLLGSNKQFLMTVKSAGSHG